MNYEITKGVQVMNSPKCLLPAVQFLYIKDIFFRCKNKIYLMAILQGVFFVQIFNIPLPDAWIKGRLRF